MTSYYKAAMAIIGIVVPACGLADTQLLLRGNSVSQHQENSFQQHTGGHQRFEKNGFHLSQAVVAGEYHLEHGVSIAGVLNGYGDGEQRAGLSQLYIKYRPLTASSIKSEVKVGAFYPQISAENTDMGWLSPHFLTNSAINSWLGEELRIGGVEFSLRQNGRQVRRNWSWKVTGSLFKGNDTIGTLLSWRGFALHDRQSLYNDRVNFLPIPGVVDDNKLDAPAWTDPFREIDGRMGYYIGAHLAHKRTSELRYYYYDNNADPTKVDPDRLYAWQTRFHSITLRYLSTPKLTFFAQALSGNTVMGKDFVNNDFHSAYVAGAYETGSLAFAARLDWYQVRDKDVTMYDPNDSRGSALTLSGRYEITENAAVTLEWQINQGEQDNLRFFQSGRDYTERLAQLALTLRL